MGSFSIWHWMIVLVVVVLIFGTKKLRNLGTDLGGAVKGFKDGMKTEEEKAQAQNAVEDRALGYRHRPDHRRRNQGQDAFLSTLRATMRSEQLTCSTSAFSELVVIGVVALVVIGPERLPRVARTAGHLLGRFQRYVADVKSDINREIELAELKKLQTSVEDAARDIQQSVKDGMSEAREAVEGGRRRDQSSRRRDQEDRGRS